MKLQRYCSCSYPIYSKVFKYYKIISFTFITCTADADGLLSIITAVTTSSKLTRAPGAIGAHAGPAVVA